MCANNGRELQLGCRGRAKTTVRSGKEGPNPFTIRDGDASGLERGRRPPWHVKQRCRLENRKIGSREYTQSKKNSRSRLSGKIRGVTPEGREFHHRVTPKSHVEPRAALVAGSIDAVTGTDIKSIHCQGITRKKNSIPSPRDGGTCCTG